MIWTIEITIMHGKIVYCVSILISSMSSISSQETGADLSSPLKMALALLEVNISFYMPTNF